MGFKRVFFILFLLVFVTTSLVPSSLAFVADNDFILPSPGSMVPLSPQFSPPILRGIKINPENPLRFDFILHEGDAEGGYQQEELKQEATKLVKYFLASLTIPQKDLWVNLSPYEKDRIIPSAFGLTEMGRDLLAEDYMLKQITASLIYPEDETGREFWKRVYEQAAQRYGTTNIPVNTFNKVWILPAQAVVYENAAAGTAFVVESKLKVMLQEDYLALAHSVFFPKAKGLSPEIQGDRPFTGAINTLGSQVLRQIVIPELTKEVNGGKNFARLRQVYNSLILAAWYKKKVKESLLASIYADKDKTAGVEYGRSIITPLLNGGPHDIDLIYQRYIQAFKKGVYNYIKEELDPITQQTVPRKYFSGGLEMDMSILSTTTDKAMIDTDDSRDDKVVVVNLQPSDISPPLKHVNFVNKSAYDLPPAIFGGERVNMIDIFSHAWKAFLDANPQVPSNSQIILQPRGSVNYMLSEGHLDWPYVSNFEFVIYLPDFWAPYLRRLFRENFMSAYVYKIMYSHGLRVDNQGDQIVLEAKIGHLKKQVEIYQYPNEDQTTEYLFRLHRSFSKGWDPLFYEPLTPYFELTPDGVVQDASLSEYLKKMKAADLLDNITFEVESLLRDAKLMVLDNNPKTYKRLAVASELLDRPIVAQEMLQHFKQINQINSNVLFDTADADLVQKALENSQENARTKLELYASVGQSLRGKLKVGIFNDISRLDFPEGDIRLAVANFIVGRLRLHTTAENIIKLILENDQITLGDLAMRTPDEFIPGTSDQRQLPPEYYDLRDFLDAGGIEDLKGRSAQDIAQEFRLSTYVGLVRKLVSEYSAVGAKAAVEGPKKEVTQDKPFGYYKLRLFLDDKDNWDDLKGKTLQEVAEKFDLVGREELIKKLMPGWKWPEDLLDQISQPGPQVGHKQTQSEAPRLLGSSKKSSKNFQGLSSWLNQFRGKKLYNPPYDLITKEYGIAKTSINNVMVNTQITARSLDDVSLEQIQQLPNGSVVFLKEENNGILEHRHELHSKGIEIIMGLGNLRNVGGIDLTTADMNLQTQNNGNEIKLHLGLLGEGVMDSKLLHQLQNAAGFVPVIINIEPLNDLKRFLGIEETAPITAGV